MGLHWQTKMHDDAISDHSPDIPQPANSTLPISRELKVEESARLLHAIFPNYPVLYPCRPTPPIEEWPSLITPQPSLKWFSRCVRYSSASPLLSYRPWAPTQFLIHV